ncbi:MAG: hypothetical protein Tsb004_14020 [Allomuricauda sp.]
MMKTFKSIVVAVIFFNFSCAQERPTQLDINKLSINKIDYRTTIGEAKMILGKPMQHKTIDDPEAEYGDTPAIYDYLFFEDLNLNYLKYEYMNDKQISSIHVKSSKIDVEIEDKLIKVGDKFEEIESILPYEYNKFLERHDEIIPDKKYQIIGGKLMKGKLEPSNIVFDFKNGEIIQISISFPL